MKKKYMLVLLTSVSFLAICLLFGGQNSNEYNTENLHISDGDIIQEGSNNQSLSFELINTTISFKTNTSADDPSKLSWGYSEWRESIILEQYNMSESELDESILNNATYQKNIHLSTIMAWGQYNGSLSEDDLLDLYNQMEHHSVSIDDAWSVGSNDEFIDLRCKISVGSFAWLAQFYEARYLRILFWSSDPNGKWHNYLCIPLIGCFPWYTEMAELSLWWTDSDPWDLSATTRTASKYLSTGSLEDNLYVWFDLEAIYNGIHYDIERHYYTHLEDDDPDGPNIYYNYYGSYTDANPGFVDAWGTDYSGGEFTTPSIWFVPNSLGTHSYTFSAIDYDNDRPNDASTSSRTVSITIRDDDITPPDIGIQYFGSGNPGDPGFWRVTASDPQSGIYSIIVKIDGIQFGTTAGDYAVPSTYGRHKISVYAQNNDIDRGSIDRESAEKAHTVIIANEGDEVNFQGIFSVPFQWLYTFQWDFGDGNVIIQPGTGVPTNVYEDDGTYEVVLNMFIGDMYVGTHTLIVIIRNVNPTVIAGGVQAVNEGETVHFLGSFTDPGGGDTHTILWDFGDGGTASGTLTPNHKYGDNGDYTVRLTVTDDDGGTDSDTLIIRVYNVVPVVDAGLDKIVNEEDTIHFTGSFSDPGWLDDHTIVWDFGDGGTASGTLTPTYKYGDNGVHTVTLTVTDDDGGTDSDTMTVTVNNVAPTLSGLTANSVNEGGISTLSGLISDPSPMDTFTLTVNWGDGSIETFIYPAGTTSFSETHLYLDDNPSGTPSDDYTLEITIEDDDGGTSTPQTTPLNFYASYAGFHGDYHVGYPLTFFGDDMGNGYFDITGESLYDTVRGSLYFEINNPYFQMTGPPSSFEVRCSIRFTNLDDYDGYVKLFIQGNDGYFYQIWQRTGLGGVNVEWEIFWTTSSNYFFQPDGSMRFKVTGESENPLWYMMPSCQVEVENLRVKLIYPKPFVTVSNVAPLISGLSATSINEGSYSTLSGTIIDPGILDTFTLTVDWGDGSPLESFTYPAGTTSFSETHQYLDDGIFTIGLSLEDDDLGAYTESIPITVSNVAPAISGLSATYVNEGSFSTISGTIFDPGILDPFTLTVDWGDGSPLESFTYPAGTTSFSEYHPYLEDGVYTLWVSLEDDDGGIYTDTITVIIYNVAPELSGLGATSVNEGSFSTLSGTIIDPGILDTLTLTVDWGDGSPLETFIYPAGTTSFSETHQYLDDSLYSISLTVYDDDGGVGTGTTTVTVKNVAPTLMISGNSEADEGSIYTLYLNSYDPGDDTISQWIINWGDGYIDTIMGNPSSVIHIYADGPNAYIITAIASDEDGTYSSGFESGDFSGWLLNIPYGAFASVVTSHYSPLNNPYNYPYYVDDQDSATTYYPIDGNYFALLKTDGPGSYTSITYTITLTAGQMVSGWAAFDNNDYIYDDGYYSTVYNDNARVRILDSNGNEVAVPWYRDCLTVGSFSDGLWEYWSWSAESSDIFTIEYSVSNAVDSTVDSYALFDGESISLSVIVNNVEPILTISGDSEVDEGSIYTLYLNSYDPGDDTISQWIINWGDGYIDTIIGNPSSVTHTYADGPDTFIISAVASDEDGNYGTTLNALGFESGDFSGWLLDIPYGAFASVVTSHYSPLNNPYNYPYYVDEQDSATTYSPVDGNYFALLKTDGPGSYTSITYTITLTAGQMVSGWAAFDNHDYIYDDGYYSTVYNDNARVRILDSNGNEVAIPWYRDCLTVGSFNDGPWEFWSWTAESSGTFTIEYSIANAVDSTVDSYALFDGELIGHTVIVNNVAPTLVGLSSTSVNEGSYCMLSGTIIDPGILDTFTLTVDWGDGSIETFYYSAGTASFTETHLYVDDNPSGTSSDVYTIVITIEDDDLGTNTASTITTVYNVDPIVDAGQDQTIIQGDTATFIGTFTDLGTADTHTLLWDFGDGSPPSDTGSHLYIAYGVYTVTFTVIDDDGGVGSDTLTIEVMDIIPPTTTLTFDIYFGEIPPYYVSTTTQFVLTAEDNPFGSGVAITQYQIDSTDPNGWVTYSVPFTINLIGTHTINYRSIDHAGNIEAYSSETFIVNAVELTYIGKITGNYSDPVFLEAKLLDIATQDPITDKLIEFTIDSQTISAITDINGVASVILILDQPSGIYTVLASFAGDQMYLSDSDSAEFMIEKENAILTYTGSTVVPLDAETITLRVTVFDDVDGYWGDLTNIYVTFILYSDTMELLATYGPYQVGITEVDGVGFFTFDIEQIFQENSYLVQVIFSPGLNHYYNGISSDLAPLIIYEPIGDFVTGGGWIWDTEGNKGNFGFNVKYKKNGLPKGQAIYVYREGDWQYIVKANAWLGMAIIRAENYSIFEAKCTIQKYNSITGELVWDEGNYRMTVEVWDEDKDGGQDVFQIKVFDKYGLVFHEAGYDPYGILQGGQIVIHTDEEK